MGDLDRDGDLDLVVSRGGTATVQRFSTREAERSGLPRAGAQDQRRSARGPRRRRLVGHRGIHDLRRSGGVHTGQAPSPGSSPTLPAFANDVAMADLDGDHVLDLAVACYNSDSVFLPRAAMEVSLRPAPWLAGPPGPHRGRPRRRRVYGPRRRKPRQQHAALPFPSCVPAAADVDHLFGRADVLGEKLDSVSLSAQDVQRPYPGAACKPCDG